MSRLSGFRPARPLSHQTLMTDLLRPRLALPAEQTPNYLVTGPVGLRQIRLAACKTGGVLIRVGPIRTPRGWWGLCRVTPPDLAVAGGRHRRPFSHASA